VTKYSDRAIAQQRYRTNHSRRNLLRDFTDGEGVSGGYHDQWAFSAICRADADRAALRYYLTTWHHDVTTGFVPGDELLLVSGCFDPYKSGHDPDPDQAELEALAAEDPWSDWSDWYDEDFDDGFTIIDPSDQPVNALADRFWDAHELGLDIDDPFSDKEDSDDDDDLLIDPDRLIWHPDDFLEAIGWTSDHVRSSF